MSNPTMALSPTRYPIHLVAGTIRQVTDTLGRRVRDAWRYRRTCRMAATIAALGHPGVTADFGRASRG